MPIDFHASSNTNTYASRQAHTGWFDQMSSVMDGGAPGTVADVGCGGGIYSRAWRELGAERVIGLDSSAQMIEDARAATTDAAVEFAVADAYETGLADETCDTVFTRAVVHHLNDHTAAMKEAKRILKPGGTVIVQDRSIEDVLQPASPAHFRAHFFTEFPRLLDIERSRRPETDAFLNDLANVGFQQPLVKTFWETRGTYQSAQELRSDLLARTGRSILHELSDDELAKLTETILAATEGHFRLDEHDRWTMWIATKPAKA